MPVIKNNALFPKIKVNIREMAPLRIRNISKDEVNDTHGNDIKDFLKSFFTNYNNINPTVYTSNGSLQTDAGKRRTIEDIYRIVSYYYPKASITKTYARLIELINEGYVCSSICEVLNKRVYRGVKKSEQKTFFNGTPKDEFGIDFSEFTFDNKKVSINNELGWGQKYGEETLVKKRI